MNETPTLASVTHGWQGSITDGDHDTMKLSLGEREACLVKQGKGLGTAFFPGKGCWEAVGNGRVPAQTCLPCPGMMWVWQGGQQD